MPSHSKPELNINMFGKIINDNAQSLITKIRSCDIIKINTYIRIHIPKTYGTIQKVLIEPRFPDPYRPLVTEQQGSTDVKFLIFKQIRMICFKSFAKKNGTEFIFRPLVSPNSNEIKKLLGRIKYFRLKIETNLNIFSTVYFSCANPRGVRFDKKKQFSTIVTKDYPSTDEEATEEDTDEETMEEDTDEETDDNSLDLLDDTSDLSIFR